MTTRKEFQEWLNRFPEDTIIRVGVQSSPSAYQSYGNVVFVVPNLEDSDYGDCWEYSDYNGERNLKLGEAN